MHRGASARLPPFIWSLQNATLFRIGNLLETSPISPIGCLLTAHHIETCTVHIDKLIYSKIKAIEIFKLNLQFYIQFIHKLEVGIKFARYIHDHVQAVRVAMIQ